METVMTFLKAALPWLGIGSLAISQLTQRDGKTNRAKFWLRFTPALCFFYCALFYYIEDAMEKGTVWIVLAVVTGMMVLISESKKEED